MHRELGGIAQHALLLGDRAAPVTVIEYADLDCASCSTVHRTVLPHVIARFVRSGEASLELRPLAARPRSRALARGAYAASTQRQGWDFVELAYARNDAGEAPARLAHALGLDVRRWRADLGRPAWTPLILGALSVARVAHFPGYPVFLVRRRGSSQPFTVLTAPRSPDAFATAIAKALRSPA